MFQKNIFQSFGHFDLENGGKFHSLELVYHTKGVYDSGKKVIWVCHALTANSNVADWWPGLFGENAYFDQEEYFVICVNVLGSCYGSTGPLSKNQEGKRYFFDFPVITIKDMARAHELLRQQLGITQVDLLIGSSLGGQQAQEFAILLKKKLDKLILIATNAQHSPFGIAFNEAQRMALKADLTFGLPDVRAGKEGLKAARSIAMLSYRSYEGYHRTQSETESSKTDDFKASSYQQHQGQKLAKRFNAYAYWFLSKAMDSHQVGRNFESVEAALTEITARTLVIGISSDLLFPPSEQQFLAKHIPNASFELIDSIFGHDGFLVETETLKKLIDTFLNTVLTSESAELGVVSKHLITNNQPANI